MHRISYNLGRKFKIEKQLKRIILHVFGRMVKCKQIDEINQIFGLLCYVLCCKKQTSAYCNMLNQLEECVKGDITVSSNAPEEFEDETDVHLNGVTYREKSPFGRHFELIYHNILDSLSEVENVSQPDPNSVSYSPQIIQFLLTYYMPLVPLVPWWSGIILSTVNSKGSPTDSNAIAENWFRIVKHNIFTSVTNIKAADFIRKIYSNIEDRIAAFKFGFSPLVHKIFKPKKRVRVENEEECKEEWSRSKRGKLSYIKPTVNTVSKVFSRLKSTTSSNVEVLSNECQANKELAMIVEKPIDFSTMMADSLSEQTVQVSENILQEVKEVEIISDLDLVEIATIEYKLPGYQPLTYRGQKILCEDLCIKFVNSTSCDRDNVLNYSNLREFIPSKLLPIPGDGNCLFSSLSYWLTGSIDYFNQVRLTVVENMVGKLKEACNKFIVNKFPMSAINYRNVSDYIAKSGMRRIVSGVQMWRYLLLHYYLRQIF